MRLADAESGRDIGLRQFQMFAPCAQGRRPVNCGADHFVRDQVALLFVLRHVVRVGDHHKGRCSVRPVDDLDVGTCIQIGMHFHDLRAKALTDLKRQRGAAAAQSLAGHTTESMTAHYAKSREVERVQPVPLTRSS